MERLEAESDSEAADLHVCGRCRAEFEEVEAFLAHRRARTCGRPSRGAQDRRAEEAAVISLLANQLQSGPPRVLLQEEDDGDEEAAAPPSAPSPPVVRPVGSRRRRERASRIYQCQAGGCGYASAYAKDLVRHRRMHTGEKPYQCDICSKKFSRQDKLKDHERKHLGIKPHQCSICSYSSSESGTLKKHMRIHTGDRPYQCQMCPYKSRSSSQLTVHLRSHTGDCPFICTFQDCSSSFKTNSDLKRHQRTHTGEKPYQCNTCEYSCAIKSNLTNHIRNHHKDAELFKCKAPDCAFKTSGKSALKSHEKKAHAANLFHCSKCDFNASSQHGLRAHEKKLHPTIEKLFECKYCDFTCKWEGALSSHMNKRHGNKESINFLDPARLSKTSALAASEDPKGGKLWLSKSTCAPNFQCGHCDACFVRLDSLQCHLRQHQRQSAQSNGTDGDNDPESGEVNPIDGDPKVVTVTTTFGADGETEDSTTTILPNVSLSPADPSSSNSSSVDKDQFCQASVVASLPLQTSQPGTTSLTTVLCHNGVQYANNPSLSAISNAHASIGAPILINPAHIQYILTSPTDPSQVLAMGAPQGTMLDGCHSTPTTHHMITLGDPSTVLLSTANLSASHLPHPLTR